MKTFIIVLIVLGIGIMLLAILRSVKILKLLREHKYIRQWKLLVGLMGSFLGGYIMTIFLVRADDRDMLLLLTGLILFGGAVFVYLVVNLEYHTLHDIFQMIRQLKRTEEEVEAHRNQLEERTFKLSELNRQMQQSGIQVASLSTELAATVKGQEDFMASQVDGMLNVEQTIGEISSTVSDLVERMLRIALISEEMSPTHDREPTDLEHVETIMSNMAQASRHIYNKLEAIREKAENITSVVTTITKVADQTNLLSLNAAIEAEKAGEYGRGFSVVAREIRRLADQTAIATLDIEQMVNAMQASVSSGVEEMDKFLTDVQHAVKNVQDISTKLTMIIGEVEALTTRFFEMNSAITQLSGEIKQMNVSLHETYLAIKQLREVALKLGEFSESAQSLGLG